MLSVVITRKGLLYLLRRESGRSRAGARWNGRNGILWPSTRLLPPTAQHSTCTLLLPPHFLQLFRRGGGSSRLDPTCSVSLALARLLALESLLGLGLRHGSRGGGGVCGGSGRGGVSFHESAHPQPQRLGSFAPSLHSSAVLSLFGLRFLDLPAISCC